MATPIQAPNFTEIAGGNIDMTGTAPADKLQGTQGCLATKGATGTCQIDISPPNNGLADADVIVLHNPGFGTSKGGGGITTTMSSLSSGSFVFTAWDQTTVPPVAIDCGIHFVIKRNYKNR